MKRLWRVVPVLLAIASPSNLHAQPTHKVAIGGAGSDSCAVWTQGRNATTELGKQASEGRIQWLAGFLSAVNFFTEPTGSLHGGIDDHDGMIAAVDTYCQAHPGDPMFAAAATLVFQLKKQAAPQKPATPP